jgi:hypothetical protein
MKIKYIVWIVTLLFCAGLFYTAFKYASSQVDHKIMLGVCGMGLAFCLSYFIVEVTSGIIDVFEKNLVRTFLDDWQTETWIVVLTLFIVFVIMRISVGPYHLWFSNMSTLGFLACWYYFIICPLSLVFGLVTTFGIEEPIRFMKGRRIIKGTEKWEKSTYNLRYKNIFVFPFWFVWTTFKLSLKLFETLKFKMKRC